MTSSNYDYNFDRDYLTRRPEAPHLAAPVGRETFVLTLFRETRPSSWQPPETCIVKFQLYL